MQEFKNGEKVTAIYAEDGTTRDANWIGMNGLLHVVEFNGGFLCSFGDKYIRPMQLICDKAREALETNTSYKTECETVEEFDELMAFIKLHGCATHIHKLYDTCPKTKEHYKSSVWPELILKTGEIIAHDVEEEYDKDAYIADLEEKIKYRDTLLERKAEKQAESFAQNVTSNKRIEELESLKREAIESITFKDAVIKNKETAIEGFCKEAAEYEKRIKELENDDYFNLAQELRSKRDEAQGNFNAVNVVVKKQYDELKELKLELNKFKALNSGAKHDCKRMRDEVDELKSKLAGIRTTCTSQSEILHEISKLSNPF